jgi:hypothetical protein
LPFASAAAHWETRTARNGRFYIPFTAQKSSARHLSSMLKVLNDESAFGLPAPAFQPDRPPRVLLTSVFGPYGVDDAFGRKENIMELFHNQVTKVQGVASMRFQHRSFGLYFIAANIDAPTTVLDFPTR